MQRIYDNPHLSNFLMEKMQRDLIYISPLAPPVIILIISKKAL